MFARWWDAVKIAGVGARHHDRHPHRRFLRHPTNGQTCFVYWDVYCQNCRWQNRRTLGGRRWSQFTATNRRVIHLMFSRLASLLKVRPDEGRLVILVAFLFACIQAGQGLGDNAASALFLLRFGVDFLPYMYIAAGVLTFVITIAYSAGLGRF